MQDFYEWYNEKIRLIVDNRYPIKGALVWTPFGFKLQKLAFDKLRELLEATGHKETRFPTLIPENQLEKEEEHVKGFKDEVYWITHGGLSKLDIPLALRPTSETVIYPMFSLWIRSHADLPLKVFQVVNTFRYETKHTRPLIRDREIGFFKEAHCAHADAADAEKEMKTIRRIYKEFFDALGIPYLILQRPDWDKFPGAEKTISFDQLMPNGKTLQIATSHYLGTNFSKMFEVDYETDDGGRALAHITCHGISGRAIAGVVSAHGDEKGLILPPEFAPVQVVIVPIPFKGKEELVLSYAKEIHKKAEALGWRVELDDGEETPGNKYYYWEERGVPFRIEIGPREAGNETITLVRRDTGEKKVVPLKNLEDLLDKSAKEIAENLRETARKRVEKLVKKAKSKSDLKKKGLVFKVEVCSPECAKTLEDECIEGMEYRGHLLDEKPEGKCLACGKKAKYVGIISNAY
ncbi:MAG: proline--tRNA ligase [Candidatus Diapherotrites archaeon]|nr:proline--tRNA ligase [Candidatus Diapherotrites archaeon]